MNSVHSRSGPIRSLFYPVRSGPGLTVGQSGPRSAYGTLIGLRFGPVQAGPVWSGIDEQP